MLKLRSFLFNTLFYLNLIVRMIVLTPIYFILPRKIAFEIPKNWARSNHWLMKTIVGTTFEIEGLENIRKPAASSRPNINPSGTLTRCCPICRTPSTF